MRKVQKQEVLEMIQTLHQAHDEIKNYIDKKNYPLAQDILSQCQECAISIGTAIEKFEGEDFVTVSYIETYCDVVFSVFEELNGIDINANKAYKNLKKQLLRIENSVKNDVPLRKEIAFFPYKASMWDSLESVYLETKKNPDYDVYCVPIPYYDRNSDRSLGQMHYEGREYPKNIEVIDWQTYNFEERKPDVVYIHNPYDEWNLVTCVHSRFFSSNLKKYTEELVYIPYFVLDEIEPDDQKTIDGMKHFCFLPGVVNADKVIVQSDKMKQIYINEYIKAAQANNLQGKHIDRKQLETKFLGLGSPKFDKVLNTKKEDLEIPEEWLKIIEKPDGSWKKIIFYNTSIAALLEHNEKMLEKMKYVFNVFKENQDEVTLLWRPHPLIKSTVSSMRPRLWEEYEKLVKQYRQEGWGIYDDSSDMDRAVVLSDAYYGDGSSVVQLCQKAGKAVMIQNVKTAKYDWSEFLFGKGISRNDESIWIPMAMSPYLIKCDQKTGNIEKYKELELTESKGWGNDYWYTDLTCVDDKIYLAPARAEKITIYDIHAECFVQIETNIPQEFCKVPGIHSQIIKTKDTIFFIGVCNTAAIVGLDIRTSQMYIVGKSMSRQQKCIYGRNVVLDEDMLYIPLLDDGKILCIDCKTREEYVVCIDSQKRNLWTINKYKNNLYVTTQDGQVLEISSDMKTVKEIRLPNENMYFTTYEKDGILWMFPYDINEYAIKLDLKTKIWEQFVISKKIYNVIEGESGKLLLNARGCIYELDERIQINKIGLCFQNESNDLERFKAGLKNEIAERMEQEGRPEYNDLIFWLERMVKG